MTRKFYQSLFLCFLIAGTQLSANAQKQPSVQENSMYAPQGIRIDGKNKEWNNTFQANNKRTNLQYTLCNDDKNLYLAVKCSDLLSSRKIAGAGLSFSVNINGKKDEKESISLTYPALSSSTNSNPGRGGQARGGRGQGGNRMGTKSQPSSKEKDSIQAANIKSLLTQAKEIQIKGLKTSTDSLISIYNELGVKAVASMGEDHVFFYEMAIPLEALGLNQNSKEFAYQLKINGLPERGAGGFGGAGMNFEELMSPTDFWGKYTLARK
eukprot:gene9978-11650_t